jgi:hypothetical protein
MELLEKPPNNSLLGLSRHFTSTVTFLLLKLSPVFRMLPKSGVLPVVYVSFIYANTFQFLLNFLNRSDCVYPVEVETTVCTAGSVKLS